jgi:hypothetical protein
MNQKPALSDWLLLILLLFTDMGKLLHPDEKRDWKPSALDRLPASEY